MWLFVPAHKLHLIPPQCSLDSRRDPFKFFYDLPLSEASFTDFTAKECCKQKPRLTVVIPSPLKKGTRRPACDHCTEPLQQCKFLSKLQFIIFLQKTRYLPLVPHRAIYD